MCEYGHRKRRYSMPVQTFAPMTKDFATFDCDAHVTEPPKIWERAHAYLTKDELEALKATIWWDADSQQLIVNGKAGIGLGSPRQGGIPGTMRVITNAGPGVKHDIQRALNVRNLNPKTALTQDQVAHHGHAGSYEPKPRLRDMDVQGIDQVMIIPTEIDIYPWLEDALGAKACCRAYNEWAYEYTLADPDRLFFAALIPMQHPDYAIEEIRRVAALGCRVALVRPMDALGNYPLQPKYAPVRDALQDRARGRRGASAAAAGVFQRLIVLVVRRLSPRRGRRLARDRDDAEIRVTKRVPGQLPRRQCPPPLQGSGPRSYHPRAGHRD